MLMRGPGFRGMGGFDEGKLATALNHIDLCLEARSAGYKVIFTPQFTAEHHESISRGSDEAPHKEARFFTEVQVMIERWGDTLRKDPFYSKHFLLDGQPFVDLVEPGVDQWAP